MDSAVLQQQVDPASSLEVYCGVWTNWSRGKVLGATLTLNRNDGNLLIAFLAFFVTVVGTQLWRIFCFALHSGFSSETPRDGLHHQRQALLRNSGTAVAGIFTLVQLVWAWRQTAKNLYRRILPILTGTILFACAFAVASGFSSRVSTSTGSEVLLLGDNCRSWTDSLHLLSSVDNQTIRFPFIAKNTAAASNYAQQCYSPNATTGSLECSVYIKKNLRTSSIRNASCPFQSGACRSENSSLLLDTGLLDTNDDFGLNAPPHQRFQYRRRLHCAPLATEGLTSQHNISSDRSYTRYHFGPTTFTAIKDNYTYEYSNDAIWESKQLQDTTRVKDYNIGILAASFHNGSLAPHSDFSPNPSIAQDDASVILFFLSANSIVFSENTTDEWYRATHIAGRKYQNSSPNETVPVYAQDEAASPLGCVQQEQLCFPNLPAGQRCTPLAARNEALDAAEALLKGDGDDDTSSTAAAARERLWWVTQSTFAQVQLESIVHTLATRSLLSRFSLYYNYQGPLPANQWQLEVELWHHTVLALFQESFVAAARGQSDDPGMDKLFMAPSGPESKKLCRNQKIRSTAYVSFSLLGLILILALGALIILVALTLEPFVAFVQRRWRKNHSQYARLEWTATGTLQLQRLAHEELGFGGAWTGAAETVPVTAPGELLAMLDMSDLEYPRLLGKEKADGCGEAEKAEEQIGEEVGGVKEGGDGEVEVRVTVQQTQGSTVSGGSEETVGAEEGVSPIEVATRDV